MKNAKILILVIAFLAFIPAANAQYDIVVVRGDKLVDSLVAQVYTQNEEVPLITVTGSGLTNQMHGELASYGSQGDKTALIIGGEEAVPKYVKTEFNQMNYSVERLWDWTRYGTAARVALTLWGESDSVVVAADYKGNIMAAAETAMEDGVPLLLTEPDSLNTETEQAVVELGVSRIVLVGEVSADVKNSLAELGTIEQTKFTLLRPGKPGSSGLFVIGIIIGGLIIFLVSSLWGAGILKKTTGVPYDILEKEEQKIIDTLMQNGDVKQSKLPEKINFSKAKVSRITSELEERNIIEKKKVGRTHVLILKKGIIK
ncbi:MAG: MarR family transcriptional regulator [Candidatus Undinarchaeales archaeon]